MDRIKYKTQKAVAHAARAPQLFGFGLFITSTYLDKFCAVVNQIMHQVNLRLAIVTHIPLVKEW